MHVMFQFKSVFSINFRLSSCEISNIDSIKEAEKNNGSIMLHSIFVWLQHLGYVYLTFETVTPSRCYEKVRHIHTYTNPLNTKNICSSNSQMNALDLNILKRVLLK